MKRRYLAFLGLLATLIPGLQAQKVLDLKQCYGMAEQTNSVSREKDTYNEIWKLKDENLSKGWLPSLDANASFVYNSEVIDMSSNFASIPIPGFADAIKPLPHEQYRLTLDINQVIYDGGAIRGARAVEKAGLEVSRQQTEADLYKLKGQVNGYYFSILMLDKQRELLESYLDLIEKRLSSMNSALENGVIIRSDIDVLSSEKIRLEQQLAENAIKKRAAERNLQDLTGIEINGETILAVPFVAEDLPADLMRPELRLFDLRKEQADAGLELLQSKRYPKAFGFATLGYGNPPGNNFFRDEFAPYYIVGAGIKWNIFDWNRVKNEKQQLVMQKEIIENRKQDLSESLKRMLESKDAEIISLEAMIKKDNELIEIRKRITSAAGSQFDNGTITATEYMNEVNAEKQAMINFEIHKLSLVMARVEYLNISGKEINE